MTIHVQTMPLCQRFKVCEPASFDIQRMHKSGDLSHRCKKHPERKVKTEKKDSNNNTPRTRLRSERRTTKTDEIKIKTIGRAGDPAGPINWSSASRDCFSIALKEPPDPCQRSNRDTDHVMYEPADPVIRMVN